MEINLVAETADQTVYEGEEGGYYSWSISSSPLLKDSKLGAGKFHLQPGGFAFPHYVDSSKIGHVTGVYTVRLVALNSSEETVIVIKKGDVVPLPSGVVSWWFNGGETDATIMFIGETTIAHVPVFGLSNKEAEDIF
ncbi:hypothetical protein Lser_V15G18339 [Lactuca serriola]